MIERIGRAIKLERIKKRLTIKDVESKSGVNRNSIIDIEKGRGYNISSLIKLLDCYEIDINEFFKNV